MPPLGPGITTALGPLSTAFRAATELGSGNVDLGAQWGAEAVVGGLKWALGGNQPNYHPHRRFS